MSDFHGIGALPIDRIHRKLEPSDTNRLVPAPLLDAEDCTQSAETPQLFCRPTRPRTPARVPQEVR